MELIDGKLILEHGEKITVVAAGVLVDIDSGEDEGDCGTTTVSVRQPEDTNLNTFLSGYSAFSAVASMLDKDEFDNMNSALIVANWEVEEDYEDEDEEEDWDDEDEEDEEPDDEDEEAEEDSAEWGESGAIYEESEEDEPTEG